MLDKEKITSLCDNIIATFAAQIGDEFLERANSLQLTNKPRIVEICDDLKDAFTRKIDNGFFATVMRPQLNVTTRKELVVVAANQLSNYIRRIAALNCQPIMAAAAAIQEYVLDYLQELERTGNYE